jgi:hypothetical protein
MVHAGDAHGRDRTAFHPTHEHPTQGIAQGDGLAAIEGPDHKDARLGAVFADLMLDAIDLILMHGLKVVKRNARGLGSEATQTRRRLERRQPL